MGAGGEGAFSVCRGVRGECPPICFLEVPPSSFSQVSLIYLGAATSLLPGTSIQLMWR